MLTDSFVDLVRISEGATSVVYRARRVGDRQKVILKVLRTDHIDPRARQEWRKEFALAASLEGENLIAPLELVEADECAIVFPDFGCVSTFHDVADGPLAVAEVLSIGIDVARALTVVHAAGLLHRDVSPPNIVRSSAERRSYLIDFGLATRRSRENSNDAARLRGTLAYISPEQTGRTNRTVDERSDLYSLGASLYHLVVGRPPFVAPDTLGIVHAHLARAPQPAQRLRSDVPTCLSAVLHRCLAKSPEERYQSARGLLHDLLECQRRVAENDSSPLVLGSHDQLGKVRLTETLVGRELELSLLRAAFAGVSTGRSRMICVTGWSGIGKTRLVNELVPEVTSAQGVWIAGKHELLGRGVPYSGLAQAFGRWLEAVVGDPAESIGALRDRVADALGDQAAVIAGIVPELSLLLGKISAADPLPPAEAERRVAVQFRELVRKLARPSHPLVLFLDDLQWADTATLQVIAQLATDPSSSHVLIVGAWRANEVTAGHPVLGMIAELAEAGAELATIEVGPLSPVGTTEFVARSLGTVSARVHELGAAIHAASAGSPFYAGRLLTGLYEDGMLSATGDGWAWNSALGSLVDVPEDAVAFMRGRLQRLDGPAQRALAVGAWLGSRFQLDDVAHVLGVGLGEAARRIDAAVALNAVARADDSPAELDTIDDSLEAALVPSFRFVHDRIQQAASEFVEPAERAATRLALAQLLVREEGARRFEAVEHAIAAGDALSDAGDRLTFARLACAAGREAIDAAAFTVAKRNFEAGISWTGDAAWAATPELALELAIGAAESSYLDADRAGMERHVARVLRFSTDPVARLEAEAIAVLAHVAANELSQALDRAVVALGGAGMQVPAQPNMLHVVRALLQTRWDLRKASYASLVELPICEDKLVATRMRLEASMLSPAFYGRPLLFPLLAFTIVRESVAHGASPVTPMGMVVFGIVLCTTGDIDGGISVGRAALALNERLRDRRLRYRVEHLWNAHLRIWFDRWQLCRDDLKTIHRACWESGDVEYAAFAAFMSCALGLHTGETLSDLHGRNAHSIAAIRSLGQQTMLHTTLMHHQIVESLMGRAADPLRLVGEAYDEVAMERVHREANDRVNLHCLAVSRAVVGTFFGDLEYAAASMRTADAWDQDAKSQPLHVVGRFYDALAHAAIGQRARANKRLRDLRKWSERGATNLAHRVAMVEAELAAHAGDTGAAVIAWDRAVHLAEQNGFPHERALALERAGIYHTKAGHHAVGRMFLLDARAAYARWGATAKVAALDGVLGSPTRKAETAAHYLVSQGNSGDHAVTSYRPMARRDSTPSLSAPLVNVTGANDVVLTQSLVGHQTTSDHEDAPLDLEALLGAARRIAGEVEASKVTAALLEGVLVLAGASSATLYRVVDDDFVAVLRASADADGVTVLPLLDQPTSSALLVEAVRSGEPVHVDQAASRFATDACLEGLEARSALVVPVVRSGRASGVLVVANRFIEGAFPDRRVAPIQALAAQAGIALENAVHYEELDGKVRLRTAELVTARREAEAERDRADGILMNVLPEPIAVELKRTGHARPVSVESASVLFTDFAGFTELASRLSAEELVAQLERCFAAFDDIVDRYGVTKLKTIGDAYMAVGGLPQTNNTHALDAVRAGLDMAAWIENPTDGRPPVPFRVRIGVHTGPLVAGVIGKRRFLYDVWGDTVNIAARMESSGEAGRVNVSDETYRLIATEVVATSRGLVKAKGKGELEMWFIDGLSDAAARA